MTLGEKLLQARLSKGLSQRQTAGEYMTRNMLSQLEHDQVTPSLKTLEYLASVLEVRVAWLLGEDAALPGESITDRARAMFEEGNWKACLSLLDEKLEPLTEEEKLLRCRAALKYSRMLFHACDLYAAAQYAEKARQMHGLYIGPQEELEAAILLAQCDLMKGDLTEEAIHSLNEFHEKMESGLQIHFLLACWYLQKHIPEQAEQQMLHISDGSFEKLLFRGFAALERQEQDAALTFLLAAEQTGSSSQLLRQELYRALEQIYKQKEDYRLAYHYAVLRMEVGPQFYSS